MRNLLVGAFAVAVFTLGASARAEIDPPVATATYTKSPEGRIETVTTAEGTTRYSYFDDGLIREVIHPNGSRDTFNHDEILARARLVDPLAREDHQARADSAVPRRGEPRRDSTLQASANRFAFTGYYFEPETGLYYAKARFYDPQVGRFSSQDSHGGDVNDPPSLNRYVYGHDNPARFTDPTGHTDEDANRLAAAMNQRTGFLAADHRPADQRGWWYNLGWQVYQDLPPRLLPMRQVEGLAKQDAAEFALGTGETVLAAAVAPLVKGTAGALVERFPVLGKTLGEAAGEALQRLRAPMLAHAPPPPVETVSIAEAMRSNGAFVATEDGRLAPLAPRIGGESQGADAVANPSTELRAGRWTGKEVRGRTVFQRSDLIDPLATDDAGLTNLHRMGAGRPPIGRDGTPVNLHHLTQMEPGSLAEVPGQFHSQYSKQLTALSNPRRAFAIRRRAERPLPTRRLGSTADVTGRTERKTSSNEPERALRLRRGVVEEVRGRGQRRWAKGRRPD